MAAPSDHTGRSPQKTKFSQQVSAIGARLTRALSMEGRDDMSVAETLVDTDTASDHRSASRGREAFQSSGRGGVGNIRRPSQTRDTGSDDASSTRGRGPDVHPDRVFSVGRGGAGNIRSPSRDPHPISETATEAEYQAQLVREHAEAAVHSSGRGGAGNISVSRSRSRGPVPVIHSTGRGGSGNIHSGSTLRPESLDEEWKHHAHHEGIHSTGRGGAGNMTSTHEPAIESVAHHAIGLESTGRGGAGNIRTRSGSRDPGSRAPSK